MAMYHRNSHEHAHPTHTPDPKCADNQNRQLYHAMTTALDDAIGNVTRALRANAMYDNTLIVFYSDNGGPLVTTGKSSNNYPLKGGKTDDFEGGTRVAAFLSGGFLPPSLRGGVNRAYMHAADWYATLCGLAGVDPTDTTAGGAVPPIDSIDQWPTILTPNATMAQGARQEMVLNFNLENRFAASGGDAALIQGEYKVVTGHQGASGFWTGPVHPNATGPPDPERNSTACGAFACCEGCLFNILDDPTEHHNLRESMPDKYAQMHARLALLGNGTYQTSYIQPGLSCLTAQQAKIYYKGFRGPLCFAGSAPVVPTPPPNPHPGFQLVRAKATSATERKQFPADSADMCLSGGDKLALAACPAAAQWRIGDDRSGELQAARGERLCIKLVESDGWNCANTPGSNATEVSMRHCALGPGGNGAHPSNYFHLVPAGEGHTDRTNTGRAVLIRSHDCPKLCVAPLAGTAHDNDMAGGNHRVGLTRCTARDAVWTQRNVTGQG